MTIKQLPTDLTGNGDGVLVGMSKWASIVTDGWYWSMALFGFCLIIFISTTRFGTPRSFGTASFIGMLGAIFLAILNLITWGVASAFIVCGFVGFAVMILNER